MMKLHKVVCLGLDFFGPSIVDKTIFVINGLNYLFLQEMHYFLRPIHIFIVDREMPYSLFIKEKVCFTLTEFCGNNLYGIQNSISLISLITRCKISLKLTNVFV